MKKLLLAIVLSLGSGILLAHHNSYGSVNKSDLNIKMWDNSNFIITLNNNQPERTRNFSLINIRPGRHYVEIVQKKRNRNGNGGFVRTVYKGKINVPARKNVFVKVEGKNRLSFKFFKKRNRNNRHNGNNGNYGSGNYNGNFGSGCSSSNTGNGYYGESNFGNGGFDNHYNSNLMDPNRFNQLIRMLGNEHFDDVRLSIARQAIASNDLTSNQVSAIMNKFTFESAKLKFAKLAYNRTVDRENYFIVNNQFTFSSSVSELNNYILNA